MIYEKGICDVCKTETKVVKSDNKLSKTLCAKCISNSIDVESSADIRKLSLTLQIPFSLKEYYTLALGTLDSTAAMDAYLTFLADGKDHAEESGVFPWDRIDDHYHAAKNFTVALAKIKPLKDALMERGAEKWGPQFTFHEYVQLESVYENTIKQFGITSTLQQDAVKKAVKISVKIDSLIDAGEFKGVKEATDAYGKFLKTANIDNLIDVSNDETIRTVADLVNFLEKNGYQFSSMMPEVDPDVIDQTINNYTENVKSIVYNHAGLDTQLRDLIEKMQNGLEEKQAAEIAETHILEDDLDDDFLKEEEQKFIRELENEEVDDIDYDDLW